MHGLAALEADMGVIPVDTHLAKQLMFVLVGLLWVARQLDPDLNPTPCNIIPKPYILHPALLTLNPKPQTLNPTPYTLNPKP
jgi:hypothetical protein